MIKLQTTRSVAINTKRDKNIILIKRSRVSHAVKKQNPILCCREGVDLKQSEANV